MLAAAASQLHNKTVCWQIISAAEFHPGPAVVSPAADGAGAAATAEPNAGDQIDLRGL